MKKWPLWFALILLIGGFVYDQVCQKNDRSEPVEQENVNEYNSGSGVIIDGVLLKDEGDTSQEDSLRVVRWDNSILYVFRGDVFADTDVRREVHGLYYLVVDFRNGQVKYNIGTSLHSAKDGHNTRSSRVESAACHFLSDYSRIDNVKRFKN